MLHVRIDLTCDICQTGIAASEFQCRPSEQIPMPPRLREVDGMDVCERCIPRFRDLAAEMIGEQRTYQIPAQPEAPF